MYPIVALQDDEEDDGHGYRARGHAEGAAFRIARTLLFRADGIPRNGGSCGRTPRPDQPAGRSGGGRRAKPKARFSAASGSRAGAP